MSTTEPVEGEKRRKKRRWLPLESNPEALEAYIKKLGGPDLQCVDILSTEDWAAEMIPQPCYGVILLYPIKEAVLEYERKEKERIDKEGQVVSPDVWFTKQTVGNACGTVALLHIVANIRDKAPCSNEGFFNTFISRTQELNADDRGQALEEDEEVETAHQASVAEGQSRVPDVTEDVNLHFVAIVSVDDHLYELDGRKPYPINHGLCPPNMFLPRALSLAQSFIARDPQDMQFSMIAVCAKQ